MKIMTGLLALALIFGCSDKQKGSKPSPDSPIEGKPSTGTTATNSSSANGEKKGLMGQALADSIMAQWQQGHKDRNWQDEVRRAHPNIPSSADNSAIVGVEKGQGEGHSYGRYTETDIETWKRETEKLVLAGARIFHNSDELGSTVGVSCDMCHPDGANTHPETYPKFQVQMGRVAHLRDMINWCLINPLRADAMEADHFRMRALEAYLLAERKGKALNFGRH